MGITMNEKKLNALANELTKDLKTPEDLIALTAQLTKITVEAALKTEFDHHLGYTEYDCKGRGSGNSRNGYSSKTLKGDHGEIEIDTPRNRNASFEPQIVSEGQTCITGMDDQVLTLYAKGMSIRDISSALLSLLQQKAHIQLFYQISLP